MAKSRTDFDRTVAVIGRWLDAQGQDEINEIDLESKAEALDLLNILAWAGAADSVIASAVARARRSGCSWAPIGLALGVSHNDARRRYTAIQTSR
ncbi:MAG TPA: hypothetical protein VFE65_25240 [Pseudonocardia sp.]|nr:hypothetical protein [Pseudonocardia sp.]